MGEKEITKEDVLFYLDMIGSRYGPSYKPKIGKLKPYYPLLKERDSEDYKRFIRVYHNYRDCLKEREKTILDFQYGLKGEIPTLTEIGEHFGFSNSRASQIRNKSERIITREILRFLARIKPKKPKQSFEKVIAAQSDEVLVQIGREIRSYEAVVEHYFNQKYSNNYKNRIKLEKLLIHLWRENELDHRQKAIKVLGMEREDFYWD
ncbi:MULTISPECIES: sigma factor-like helix-turn-helix DNA-binding protein [Bacillaceae]|uniref:RNA polymerase sigma-70 region 4 domain-containing protein n=1 Tax=Evansella alkalicola TaxID=745819 RepID=A0ABS6JX17_9BACI|nr:MULTISPECIES: sigma factor-like helix-turn-helix DNA-binding protein [Bacillaceae]MBU9723137.1 hypothetical protein [Bacillus alkalicola]